MAFITKNNKKGFTLAEAVISIVIIVVISLILANIIISAYSVVSNQRAYLNLQQETAATLRNISKNTREAVAVARYPEEEPVIESGPDTLVLKMIGLDENGEPAKGIYDFFIYSLDGQTLKLEIKADDESLGRKNETLVVSNFVDKIIFRYNNIGPTDSDIITLTLISSNTVNGQIKQIKAQTSAYLRN